MANAANPSREEIIAPLCGWLRKEQIDNIKEAIDNGSFNMETYLSLNPEYVHERLDNGGFTPREQYALRFAENYGKRS